MKIVIHRGNSEIGAACLEIQSESGARIVLDAGAELEGEKAALPPGIGAADAVFISHAHPDHFGLAGAIPKNVPIYCGEIAGKIIQTAGAFGLKFGAGGFEFTAFKNGVEIRVKDICITPILTDHSVPDSYAFLVQSGSKKVLYTGDFRLTGRKQGAAKRLLKIAANPDALIVEGTRVEGRGEGAETEAEVEKKIADTVKAHGVLPAFAICSGINVDRIVSIYKACKKCGRVFVCDIYTALILWQMGKLGAKVPQMTWSDVRVLSRGGLFARHRKLLEKSMDILGVRDFRSLVYSRGIGITLGEIAAAPGKFLIKTNQIEAVMKECRMKRANIIYSMWSGYMDEKFDPLGRYQALEAGNIFSKIHASGHIGREELFDFIDALSPKKLVPFHTNAPEKFKEKYPLAITCAGDICV